MPYIDDLDETYPDGDVHAGSVLDDDLRSIKETLGDCFANVAGVVTPDHHLLNRAAGLDANVATQMTNLSALISTQESASYVLSGLVSGSTITGPFWAHSLLDTWSVNQLSPGQLMVIHNMSLTLGLGVNDYIVSVSAFGSSGVAPTVAVSQDASSFTVSSYSHTQNQFVTVPFVYFIVIL